MVGKRKRNISLLHDNVKHRVAKGMSQTKENIGWKVLSHLSNSPNIAPYDYHIFLSLKDFLQRKDFKNVEVHKAVDGYFESKEKEFHWRSIHNLSDIWNTIIVATEIILIYYDFLFLKFIVQSNIIVGRRMLRNT